jgi:hypothetical protein
VSAARPGAAALCVLRCAVQCSAVRCCAVPRGTCPCRLLCPPCAILCDTGLPCAASLQPQQSQLRACTSNPTTHPHVLLASRPRVATAWHAPRPLVPFSRLQLTRGRVCPLCRVPLGGLDTRTRLQPALLNLVLLPIGDTTGRVLWNTPLLAGAPAAVANEVCELFEDLVQQQLPQQEQPVAAGVGGIALGEDLGAAGDLRAVHEAAATAYAEGLMPIMLDMTACLAAHCYPTLCAAAFASAADQPAVPAGAASLDGGEPAGDNAQGAARSGSAAAGARGSCSSNPRGTIHAAEVLTALLEYLRGDNLPATAQWLARTCHALHLVAPSKDQREVLPGAALAADAAGSQPAAMQGSSSHPHGSGRPSGSGDSDRSSTGSEGGGGGCSSRRSSLLSRMGLRQRAPHGPGRRAAYAQAKRAVFGSFPDKLQEQQYQEQRARQHHARDAACDALQLLALAMQLLGARGWLQRVVFTAYQVNLRVLLGSSAQRRQPRAFMGALCHFLQLLPVLSCLAPGQQQPDGGASWRGQHWLPLVYYATRYALYQVRPAPRWRWCRCRPPQWGWEVHGSRNATRSDRESSSAVALRTCC